MHRERWYAVQTKPRSEEQVMSWLPRRTTAQAFLPKLQSVRRRGTRKIVRLEPLFPSYLFVRFAAQSDDWARVKWTPGVRDIVTSGGIPVPVPEEAVEMLQLRMEDGVIRVEPRLPIGTPVRIIHGSFAGLVGILERPTSRGDRVRVLLDLMNRVAPVEVDVVDLEAVGGRRAG